MKEIIKEKSCVSCVYYEQHYGKVKTYFQKVFCGHCTNNKPSGHFRKTNKICEFYEEKNTAEEREKQLKSLTEYLCSVSETLEQLKELLDGK